MDRATKEFLNYTDKYLKYGERIKLKVNHTFRVVDLCENIAKSINLSDEYIDLARLVGLLHDIGRFEQWKRFKTYKDSDSIDHADLGEEILKNNNYLRKFIEEDKYDDIILKSVKYHNKYKLPNDLSEDEELFCKIVRDADKIDILYLYTIKGIELEIDNEFSEDIFKSLLEMRNISRKKLSNKTDRLAISLGFIFDMNFIDSFKYLKEKDYYNTIIDMYKNKSNNEKLKEQLELVREVINNYIEVRVC